MKKYEKGEPALARLINIKRAKRKSRKKAKTMINRAIRKELKRNLNIGKEIVKQNLGYEF